MPYGKPMPAETNPYQAPQAAGQSHVIPRRDIRFTTMVLIFIAICLGIASFLPWLGVLFLLLSTPVFIRYSRRETIRRAGPAVPRDKHVASVLGSAGLALSILLATAGTFWGTCHTSGFLTAMAMDQSRINGGPVISLDAYVWIFLEIGITTGMLCGGWTLFQLRKLLHDPVVKTEEPKVRHDGDLGL